LVANNEAFPDVE